MRDLQFSSARITAEPKPALTVLMTLYWNNSCTGIR